MPKQLTEAQIAAFAREGYVAPVPVLTTAEVTRHRAALEAFETAQGKPLGFPEKSKCHLLFGWADALVHHPAVLDAVEDLIGPDIMLLHFTLQTKEAHSPTFAEWHQDDAYFHLDPAEEVTAWLALSEASELAGCMRMLPGSHLRGKATHVDRPDAEAIIRRSLAVEGLSPEDGVPAPLKAGEMSIHHTHTLHASGPNRADDRRIGLTLSYIPTRCRPTNGVRPMALLVRGEDRYGFYEREERLVEELSPLARQAHRRGVGLFGQISGTRS